MDEEGTGRMNQMLMTPRILWGAMQHVGVRVILAVQV